MHLAFSGSRTHEKGDVIGSPFRFAGIVVGGVHVATVNMSTNLRIKNFGNVPPRLETLYLMLAILIFNNY